MKDRVGGFDPIAYINEPRWRESRLGLERIRDLLERMGRPQDRLKFVHVAGTNGKGSVCAYLAGVLHCAGYKTGLFTSPYIMEFEERIRVDGANISRADLTAVTLFVRECAEAMEAETGEHPTEFELMSAVAFEHFARSGCDIVVCEVGLGGRLDSTNVIEAPEVCVITRIGLDHTDVLGDTVARIAREKAGIVKPGASVVAWPQEDAAALDAIVEAARAVGASVRFPDLSKLETGPVSDGSRAFKYRGRAFSTALLGSYQPFNAALAIESAWALRERGWRVPDEAIARGIAETAWPGRFEVVSNGRFPVVIDGGHNPQGAAVLADSLADVFPGQKAVFVMSVLADKDYRAMIRAVMPLAQAFVCVTAPNPRALLAEDLAAAIRSELEPAGSNGGDVPVECADGFPQAFERASRLAVSGPLCAFGSLYSIAAIKQALAR